MTGSLQVKHGKYYAVMNVVDREGKRKQKWVSTGLDERGNKRNAEKFLRDLIVKFELQDGCIPADTPLASYLYVWLKSKKGYIEEDTYQSYETVIRAHLVPYFTEHRKTLVNTKRKDIQMYVDYKYGECGLSAKTIKSHMVIIKQAFIKAVRDELIPSSPCDYIVMPKVQKYIPKFYTEKQANALLLVAKDHPIYPLIYFTVNLGLRRSEVLGVKWDAISFEDQTLTIQHTVVDYSGIIAKDRTKNEASRRVYPLTDDDITVLRKLKKEEAQNRKFFGNTYIDNDYVFKRANGDPFKPDYVSRSFSRILAQNNLPIIRFHDLRHTCASILINRGYTLKDAQEWLGHSDIQTTANIYAHLSNERKKNIANVMTESLRFEAV